MELKKKLKQRMFVSLSWAVLGLVMILFWCITRSENTYPLSLGIAFVVMGVMRIISYRKITKDEKTIRRQELAETDERNRMMSERAKSWAFSFTIMIAGIAVIILSLMGNHDAAQPIAWLVCGETILYWICWNIIRKKY